MERVLVSACLLGQPVRYNGKDKRSDAEILQRWIAEGRVVPVCPEVAGGLSVPRLPAEIVAGTSRVIDSEGRDVTEPFVAGARHALASARGNGIRIAVLKEGSPSCGTAFVYDGTFTGTKVSGPGVTSALLRSAGIHVFNESELSEADAVLRRLESRA